MSSSRPSAIRVPFKVRTIRCRGGQIYFAGRWLSLWDSFGLGNFELRAGNFSEDSRGRWYLNVRVLSTRLVKAYGAISVGNVNASALAKTRMAKSVLDAGWSTFRTMLQYKCAHAGVWFDEVDEAFVNAAHIILAAGHRRLAEGILGP